jgi:hypothetical protein
MYLNQLQKTHGMARTYAELDAWQLANQLKLGVYALTETGSVTRDFRFANNCGMRRFIAKQYCGRVWSL